MRRFIQSPFAVLIGVLCLAAPISAYVVKRSIALNGDIVANKWKNGAIAWRINPVRPANIQGAREMLDVTNVSMASWQALTSANLTFAVGTTAAASLKPGFDGINLITANVSAADYALACPPGTLACTSASSFAESGTFTQGTIFAGQIDEADIIFNPEIVFNTGTTIPTDQYDFQSVMTHELGHFLGLEHTTMVSSVMFWTIGKGATYPRSITADDTSGILSLYPTAAFAAKGTITGTVRNTANVAIYGAVVTVVNANGSPVASAVTNPTGQYTIAGLDAGSYSVYAEPLDQPIQAKDIPTLAIIYPGSVVNTSFTTRFK